jgi:hypothetical protein
LEDFPHSRRCRLRFDRKVTVTNRLVSKDQELRDFLRAFDDGALSRDKYEQQRRELSN